MARPARIAVALGDPNGIGPEVAVKAAAHFVHSPVLQPVLVGDEFVVRQYVEQCAPGLPLARFDPKGDVEGAILFSPVRAFESTAFSPGAIEARAGAATVAYVREAVRMVQEGHAAAVVGCPHSETSVKRAGIRFAGYPGLIAELTGTAEDRVFLMLVAGGLRIAHVTLHESVRAALARLDAELVIEAARAAVEAARRLRVGQPRLAVFGINPHAGEDGLFGDDDERVTKPAVERLRALGMQVEGPAGADVLLAQRRHDVYLAMFHDQGHIPVKLLSPRHASALAIGAPVLFSSVGHGSAFDIAGRGLADPSAVIEALSLLGGLAAGRDRPG